MASFSFSSLVIMSILLLGSSVISADQVYNPSAGIYDSTLSDESYYSHKCGLNNVLETIKLLIRKELTSNPRMGAYLLRLHFHDCFVNGCDASVLLDNTTATNGEKFAAPNFNSLRGFEFIDTIKSVMELTCRQTVSCADILAVAARDSVDILSGGFARYEVNLGRKDSKTADINAANKNLPPPFLNVADLLTSFGTKGFNARDLVALSGGHTIGKARCVTFRSRVWNETNIDKTFASDMRKVCPQSGNDGEFGSLDSSDKIFDNRYFRDLKVKKGLLHSDQQLYNGGRTDQIVENYANFQDRFYKDFGIAMIKMGKLAPANGFQNGEIRTNCRRNNIKNN